jgi:hypothetical protein
MTGYLAPEHRGEWTDPKGKLHHRTANGSEHVGSWLTCDTCNPVQVVGEPAVETRLGMLRAEYAEAKAAKERADEREAELKAKLKTALAEATGGALRSALHVPGYPPLLLTYGERWTVDSKALKADLPMVYAQFAKLGGSWAMTESKAKP